MAALVGLARCERRARLGLCAVLWGMGGGTGGLHSGVDDAVAASIQSMGCFFDPRQCCHQLFHVAVHRGD